LEQLCEKSALLTVTGPTVSAKRLGWRKEELTKNLPSASPSLATGGYDATKHSGALQIGFSVLHGLVEYALSKSARINIYIYQYFFSRPILNV
jgi:hypothetical protein